MENGNVPGENPEDPQQDQEQQPPPQPPPPEPEAVETVFLSPFSVPGKFVGLLGTQASVTLPPHLQLDLWAQCHWLLVDLIFSSPS